jgi:hypothetical protein
VKATVIATLTAVGYHRWPDAPPHRAYLRTRHRHLFWFRVEVEVEGLDRVIECHDLAHFTRTAIGNAWHPGLEQDHDFDTLSCEAIAETLATILHRRYNAPCRVQVLEDNENGAMVSHP